MDSPNSPEQTTAADATTESPDIGVQQTPQYIDIMQRLSYLESALQEQDPRMKDHLKEIHKSLIQHEELVHLLKEEEIAKIMQAQQVITNTTLVAAVSSASGKRKAAAKAATMTLGDL